MDIAFGITRQKKNLRLSSLDQYPKHSASLTQYENMPYEIHNIIKIRWNLLWNNRYVR